MLDAFIIDEIRKREEAERQRRNSIQPAIPLPLPPPPGYERHSEEIPSKENDTNICSINMNNFYQ